MSTSAWLPFDSPKVGGFLSVCQGSRCLEASRVDLGSAETARPQHHLTDAFMSVPGSVGGPQQITPIRMLRSIFLTSSGKRKPIVGLILGLNVADHASAAPDAVSGCRWLLEGDETSGGSRRSSSPRVAASCRYAEGTEDANPRSPAHARHAAARSPT